MELKQTVLVFIINKNNSFVNEAVVFILIF